MISMTGYSNVKWRSKELNIELSLKAVNGRFLELRFHLPKEYMFLEPEMRKIISATFQRGTLDFFCHRKTLQNISSKRMEVDHHLAQQIFLEASKIQKNLKLEKKISVFDILNLAPVITFHDDAELTKSEVQTLTKLFKDCVQKCHEERIREGHSIKKELLNLLNLLSMEISLIKKQRVLNSQEVIKKWRDKIKTKGSEEMADDQKIQQEIFFLAEKADISEEIQRLEEHLKNYKNLLLSKKSEGKKIDFYTQELLREINTIGSKSQSSTITQHVVESKSYIEKLREQAQNIE